MTSNSNSERIIIRRASTGIKYEKRERPMPVNVPKNNLSNTKKGDKKVRRENTESIRIALVIYGSRDLAECMKSVIRLHMNE